MHDQSRWYDCSVRESEGCAVLKERFEAAGLAIVERFALGDLPGAITLNGYDPARRIGYEFITWEAADHEELTPEIVEALERRMAAVCGSGTRTTARLPQPGHTARSIWVGTRKSPGRVRPTRSLVRASPRAWLSS